MQTTKTVMVLTLSLLMSGLFHAPPVFAHQQSLATGADMDDALQRAVEDDEATRGRIRSTLASDEVQRLAAELGLSSVTLTEAAVAVDTLEGAELEEVASHAAGLEEGLAGGQTVTISLVALLLIVIIVILVA